MFLSAYSATILFLDLQRMIPMLGLSSGWQHEVVDGGEVEIHFAGVFGHEGRHLEIDDDEASELR
jgi:hypothetical protein